MKRLIANLALLAGALLFTLAAAEGAARWLLSRPPQRFPQTKLERPHAIRNSLGYRDYEYPQAKPRDVFRVIAIGDSFTQGHGVNFDDIYAKRLERYLHQHEDAGPVRFQVMQWGRPGSSTPHEVRKLRRQAPRFDPDLIVLGYCINDSEDESDRTGVTALRQRLFLLPPEPTGGARGFLARHSGLYRLVAYRIRTARVNRGYLEYNRAIYDDGYPGWQKTRAAILDLGAFSRESGIPVVVMIFPLFSWDLDERYPLGDVHRKLREAIEEAGLRRLDLLPAYAGLDHFYLEAVPYKDPHPSNVAHEVAAEELYLYLKSEGLLPPAPPEPPRGRRLDPPWDRPAAADRRAPAP